MNRKLLTSTGWKLSIFSVYVSEDTVLTIQRCTAFRLSKIAVRKYAIGKFEDSLKLYKRIDVGLSPV